MLPKMIHSLVMLQHFIMHQPVNQIESDIIVVISAWETKKQSLHFKGWVYPLMYRLELDTGSKDDHSTRIAQLANTPKKNFLASRFTSVLCDPLNMRSSITPILPLNKPAYANA